MPDWHRSSAVIRTCVIGGGGGEEKGGVLLEKMFGELHIIIIKYVNAKPFLQYNKLHALNAEIFVALPLLEILDLQSNQINVIEPRCFQELSSLQKLFLSYNHLTTLKSESFYCLIRLKEIYLTGNLITQLPKENLRQTDKGRGFTQPNTYNRRRRFSWFPGARKSHFAT